MDDIDFTRAKLIADSSRGIWIPKFVIENYEVDNVSDEDREILCDPEHEHHHEVLEDMLKNAVVTLWGEKYSLYYDGDMLAIPLNQKEN